MKKTLIKSIVALIALGGIVSCNGGGKNNQEGASIVLDQLSISIEKFEGQLLTYSLINIDEPVVWSVDNADIATVTDGYVYGVNVGQCEVTLTAGKFSKTCQVSVDAPSQSAVLYLEQNTFTIFEGTSVKKDIAAIYKGERVDATFSFEYADGADASVAAASYNNGLVIDGYKAGTTTIVVSTNVRDTLLVGNLNIEVVAK